MSINPQKRLKIEFEESNEIPKSLCSLFNKVKPKYESIPMDVYNSCDEEMKLYFEICIEQLADKLNAAKKENYDKLEILYCDIWLKQFDDSTRRKAMIYNSTIDMFATVCKNKGYEYENVRDSNKINKLVIYLKDDVY
jgi:hypothetical protein